MSKIMVLYQSKYGATGKYANWLSEELSCDITETKQADIKKVEKYDIIILGGGIYATGIAGISFLKKHFDRLKHKKIVVFAVGASPYYEKAIGELKQRNMSGELSEIPLFYCRGAWSEDKMSWKDRTLCGLLKKMVSKRDPVSYEPWEAALMQAVGKSHDWTEKEQLAPILEYVRTRSL